jgi:hypothetical protein
VTTATKKRRRVDPALVLKAYERTGLKPTTGSIYRMPDKDHWPNGAACALGALYCKAGRTPSPDKSEMWDWAFKTFGETYVSGFWRAFDYPESRRSMANSIDQSGDEYGLGVFDGIRAHEAVFGKKESS